MRISDWSSDVCSSDLLVVTGPEEPLVKGIVDYFLASDAIRHIPVIGPGREGAQLEGSKDFSKQFMQRHNIPTATYATFSSDERRVGKECVSVDLGGRRIIKKKNKDKQTITDKK